MLTRDVHSPHIKVLAERLISDIRHRGLAVGDRYLTTNEVCRVLGVGKTAACKAMRHLVDREILVSRKRSGTFIGPGVAGRRDSKVRIIYVLLPAGDPAASNWLYQPIIAGIHSEFPDINVQFTYVPEKDSVAFVRELIGGPRASGQFAGVVAVSNPLEVYRYLAEERVPAVVYGSVYPTGLPISSVDKDNFQSGRLLTEYLIGHGHRRIAFLMTGGGLPGNNIFLDGISDALTAGGLPPNALVSRMMGNDMEAFQAVTQELLESPDRPTAIITRVSVQVGAVAVAASNAGLRVPDDVEIVFEREDHNQPASGVDPTSYPRVQCKLTPTEIAALIGKILREVSEGVSPRSRRELIPVELHEPDRCRRLETER